MIKLLSRPSSTQQKHVDKDIHILQKFIQVYCKHHHRPEKNSLCDSCNELLEYAIQKREKCPYDPKPACKRCPTHCYQKGKREQIKQIMKYSGIYYVKRGRIDWLIKYLLH